ncbi:hypothetical protein PC129_g13505 [Phytophthora cactorum]|nr:hypothetical protein Pcac1_g9675 [Phytophthora cactorum]KAG2836443.1 hypothetical protein PC112_g5297 [Phytophthora cactorum]KAG2911055.1 hypothetical protein PC114_g9540 [Phytophthora cactorum]KAG3017072.1 hypothetical protein PC119_g11150 [Phytophthora cactorum]KAG3184379.1 hypothetical protein PC128_g13769 [Phytophthora cactorum]
MFPVALHQVPFQSSIQYSSKRHLPDGQLSAPCSNYPRPREAPFRITPGTVRTIKPKLQAKLQEQELFRCNRLASAFRKANVRQPRRLVSDTSPIPSTTTIDRELCSALSELVAKESLSLEDRISLWRKESNRDTRPNKALDPMWLDILLHGYHQRSTVADTPKRSVSRRFTSPRAPDRQSVRNHNSARSYGTALERSLAGGQASGTYLVLEIPVALRWGQLRFSPFGCVPKTDTDPAQEARLIHDVSYPGGSSINVRSTQEDSPTLEYESVRCLALRIEFLAHQHPHLTIKMLKGDVKSAFRLIPVSPGLAAYFAGSRRQLAIIDLALPFGWTGSPAHYGAFGGAISFLVSRESPNSMEPIASAVNVFFSYVWVDDHILLEVDHGNRLALAKAALRLGMLATLGPAAINEKHFLK